MSTQPRREVRSRWGTARHGSLGCAAEDLVLCHEFLRPFRQNLQGLQEFYESRLIIHGEVLEIVACLFRFSTVHPYASDSMVALP